MVFILKFYCIYIHIWHDNHTNHHGHYPRDTATCLNEIVAFVGKNYSKFLCANRDLKVLQEVREYLDYRFKTRFDWYDIHTCTYHHRNNPWDNWIDINFVVSTDMNRLCSNWKIETFQKPSEHLYIGQHILEFQQPNHWYYKCTEYKKKCKILDLCFQFLMNHKIN